jgi:hypothetical protein
VTAAGDTSKGSDQRGYGERRNETFQGISVALLLVCTFTARLTSGSMPPLLSHSVRSTVLPCDFILPMVLFAFGVYAARFSSLHRSLDWPRYLTQVFTFALPFLLAGILLSPLTAGFGGVDDMMLVGLLFVPTAALARSKAVNSVIAVLAIFALYVVMSDLHVLPNLEAYPLGGWAGVLFALPIMLAGTLTARDRDTTTLQTIVWLLGAVFLSVVKGPYRATVSPAFVSLSVVVCQLGFPAAAYCSNKLLRDVGAAPLRYWVGMHVILALALIFESISTGATMVEWPLAMAVAIAALSALYLVTRGFPRARLMPRYLAK